MPSSVPTVQEPVTGSYAPTVASRRLIGQARREQVVDGDPAHEVSSVLDDVIVRVTRSPTFGVRLLADLAECEVGRSMTVAEASAGAGREARAGGLPGQA